MPLWKLYSHREFETSSGCTLQFTSTELFPLHNFQQWDCHCLWAYSFGIGEVWWIVLPPRDDSLLSAPEETTPHSSRASGLDNRSLSPIAFTPAQVRLQLLATKPTLPVKTAQYVGITRLMWNAQDTIKDTTSEFRFFSHKLWRTSWGLVVETLLNAFSNYVSSAHVLTKTNQGWRPTTLHMSMCSSYLEDDNTHTLNINAFTGLSSR